MVYTAALPFSSQLRAGCSALYRTATSVASAIAGTFRSESFSLVVAARPSAGRSLAAKHHAACSVQSHRCSGPGSITPTARNTTPVLLASRCCTGLSSGTLPVVNTTPILKVVRDSVSVSVSAAKARAAIPPAPPNPAVNGTPHGRPGLGFISFSPKPVLPRAAGYLER